MTVDVLRRLKRRYVDLAREYEVRLGPRREHITLKRNHSLRVHALAVRITGREQMTERSAYLAAALLHDVGRFAQYEQYGTYRDDQSVDHGNLSAEVLEHSDFLDDFDPAMRAHIIDAVRLHNKRLLPEGLDSRTLSLCNLVRDADKLDIVPVVLGKMLPGGPRDSVVTLGLADEPEGLTQSVVEAVAGDQSPAYQGLRFLNDFALLLASWGPGLEYGASRRFFAERGYLDRLFAIMPQTKQVLQLKASLRARLYRD